MKSIIFILTNSYEKLDPLHPGKLISCNIDGTEMETAFLKNATFKVERAQNVLTAAETREIISNFVANCKEELHTVYFYFSGHGGNDLVKPRDASKKFKEREDDFILTDDGKGMIPAIEIMLRICSINAKHKVLVFDCCRGPRTQGSGLSVQKEDIRNEFTHEMERNTWILKASTEYHVAYAMNKGTSLFTGLFLDALKKMRSEDGQDQKTIEFPTIGVSINREYQNRLGGVEDKDTMGCELRSVSTTDVDVAFP